MMFFVTAYNLSISIIYKGISMSSSSFQPDNRSTTINFSFADITSGSSLEDNNNLFITNPFPQKFVNGTSALLLGLLLFNPSTPIINPVEQFSVPGTSAIFSQEFIIHNATKAQQLDEDIELDSPVWLSNILSELQARDFVRINDPRNRAFQSQNS